MSRHRPGQVSLERALSKLGLASRTQARQLIEDGKVKVNGVTRTNPTFGVRPETARLEIEGEKKTAAEPVVLLLHKPRGTVTTRSDEKGRPTVFSLIRAKDLPPHLVAVGRLDIATTGLLILTNDTRLSAWLTDPLSEIPRTYVVTVRGEVTEEKLNALRKGIRDEGELLRPSAVELRKSSGKESHLTVTLTEGKNREIRRLFLAIGNEVTRLKRIAYGALELGDLAAGAYRKVTAAEMKAAFPTADRRRDPTHGETDQ